MAIPSRKSRRITVGQKVFRWHFFDDIDQPWHKVVSIVADDNLNGSYLYAGCDFDGVVTPAIIRRLIDTALQIGWDPTSGKEDQSDGLTQDQIEECFHNYARILTHKETQFSWKLDANGGLHMKIRSAANPKGQLLATYCTLQRDDCTERLAIAFIDAALDLGWQHDRPRRDCFWLEADVCSRVLASFRNAD